MRSRRPTLAGSAHLAQVRRRTSEIASGAPVVNRRSIGTSALDARYSAAGSRRLTFWKKKYNAITNGTIPTRAPTQLRRTWRLRK